MGFRALGDWRLGVWGLWFLDRPVRCVGIIRVGDLRRVVSS